MEKYQLSENKRELNGHILYQIRAISNFGQIKAGQLGGWVESDLNLQINGIPVTDPDYNSGEAWIDEDACVFSDARVHGNARVFGNARVYGNAEISGAAKVYGNAKVGGNVFVGGNAQIFDNAFVTGDFHITGNAQIYGEACLGSYFEIGGKEKIHGITADRITFRKITPEDAEFIVSLETPEASREPITVEGTRRWIGTEDKTRTMFIPCVNEKPYGIVRANKRDGYQVLSFALDAKYRGKGFGKVIVHTFVKEKLRKNLPLKCVIKRNNIASEKIAQSFGLLVQTCDAEGFCTWIP